MFSELYTDNITDNFFIFKYKEQIIEIYEHSNAAYFRAKNIIEITKKKYDDLFNIENEEKYYLKDLWESNKINDKKAEEIYISEYGILKLLTVDTESKFDKEFLTFIFKHLLPAFRKRMQQRYTNINEVKKHFIKNWNQVHKDNNKDAMIDLFNFIREFDRKASSIIKKPKIEVLF